MQDIIERIRRNDPRETRFTVYAYQDRFDAEVTEALEQNPHIVSLQVHLPTGTAPGNWPRLTRHLETCNNLHTVKLYCMRQENVPQAMVHNFLQAVQWNTSIRVFELHLSDVSVGTIVSFLDTATRITGLTFYGNITNIDEINDGPARLAASIQGMANLQYLHLGSDVPAEYLIAIFDSLKRKQKQSLEKTDGGL